MEPPSPHRVEIVSESATSVDTGSLLRGILACLRIHGAEGAGVSVLLADDERLRELNRRFRNLDEPTDVLSFPAAPMSLGVPRDLGDLAISITTAESQAGARGVGIEDHVAMLAIHGTLHLLGFDDGTESESQEMLRRMNEAARAAGIREIPDWRQSGMARQSEVPA